MPVENIRTNPFDFRHRGRLHKSPSADLLVDCLWLALKTMRAPACQPRGTRLACLFTVSHPGRGRVKSPENFAEL
jgi:hypothetical protein